MPLTWSSMTQSIRNQCHSSAHQVIPVEGQDWNHSRPESSWRRGGKNPDSRHVNSKVHQDGGKCLPFHEALLSHLASPKSLFCDLSPHPLLCTPSWRLLLWNIILYWFHEYLSVLIHSVLGEIGWSGLWRHDAYICAKSLQLCLTLCDPAARQAPLSMGFSRQEYWSGLPCPPPGDLPDPGIEPRLLSLPALAGRLTTSTTCKAWKHDSGLTFQWWMLPVGLQTEISRHSVDESVLLGWTPRTNIL